MAADVLPSNIAVSIQFSSDLLLTIQYTGDVLTVRNWLAQDNIDGTLQVNFADGTLWDAETLLKKSGGRIVEIGGDIIYGGGGNDVLTGTSGNDFIYAKAGNDCWVAVQGAITWSAAAAAIHTISATVTGRTLLNQLITNRLIVMSCSLITT
jgi:Ca2+-binding RTX toxin-like protein